MAVNNSSENSIVEIRDEQMVDPTSFNANPNPIRRTAHFLRPSLNPNSSSPPVPPKTHPFSVTSTPNIKYLCCSHPLEGWQTWVHDLESTHGSLWRKSGIFDAIMNSTYHIAKNTQLLFRLVERWCPETNTFVFPWGEATLTLEDVFVLGGFSPLGACVLTAALEDNVKEVENKLIESYRELAGLGQFVYVSYSRWKEHFMGCGKEIEHAGFLALWLTRHVFPPKSGSMISQGVFAIAARVCCGDKLAFGPAILASIYRDLTVLKGKIVSGYCFDSRPLKLLSPLQLVKVWAWERFPPLGPVPKKIKCGDTRLARWESESRTRKSHDDIGMLLDSARDTFRWRPYAVSLENWTIPRFYVDSGTWVMVDSDEEWKTVARFLMVSQLVGLDCVEGYNPHRVALQFGFDQDIPECIDRYKADACEPGLLEYEKNLNGLKLYRPHRLHEGDVTYRYSNWLKRPNPVEEKHVGFKRRSNNITKAKKKTSKICDPGDELVAVDIGGSVIESPLEKLQPLPDFSSRQLLQGGSVNELTCMLNMQSEVSSREDTSVEEDEESEARISNFSVSEAVNGECNIATRYSNAVASQTKQMAGSNTLIEQDINIVPNKSAEIELSLDSNKGSGCMKLSEVRLGRKPGYGVMHSLCSTVPCNELWKNKEQMLIKQNVMIEKNSEYLEQGDKSRSETAFKSNTSLIAVASQVNVLSLIVEKDEPDEALCQDTDINNADIPVDGQEAVHVLNPFSALCFEYESRIGELEREISALSAANVLSARV